MEDEMSRKEITTMANGLRKLIKRARKQFTNNSNRRFENRFGNRLKVEELEERIAPAFTAVAFDGDATDDVVVSWSDTGDDAAYLVATGQVAFIGGNSSLDVSFTPAADGMGNLTITNGTGVGATETLYIATNGSIGTLDFSSLGATTTQLDIVIHAGVDFVVGTTGWTEAELAGAQAHGEFAPAAGSNNDFQVLNDTLNVANFKHKRAI